MATLVDVLSAVNADVTAAINNAGITTPIQVVNGWPNFDDLTKIIQQTQGQVTVFAPDGGGHNTTRFPGQWMQIAAPVINLTATVSGNTLTFGGVAQANLNIHTLFAKPTKEALYQTTGADTLNSIASGVAAAINSAGGTASATGAVVTISGPSIKCNIGGSATLAREATRVLRPVHVTYWMPSPVLRDSVMNAVEGYVGTLYRQMILCTESTLPGTPQSKIWVRWQTNGLDDQYQQDYNMFVGHSIFSVEYPVWQTQTATQIGATSETYQNMATGATIATIIGG